MAYSFGPRKVVTDGLVLYLDAGNRASYPGSGNTWFDLSGYSNHGTLTNGASFSSENSGTIIFDGSDDYVDCGPNLTPSQITISLWLYSTSYGSNNPRFISNGNPGISPYKDYYIGHLGSSFLYGGVGNGLSNGYTPTSTTFNLNQWYNVVMRYDTSNFYLYLNNNQIIQNPYTGNISYSGSYNTLIGRSGDLLDSGTVFTGKISVVMIYNRALTLQEISQNYNAQKSRFGL